MCLSHVVFLCGIILCSWLDKIGGCRSTNTSPGAGGLGHTATMARSASMALAAQAAAAASLRHQTPVTPLSPPLSVPSPSPSHATFTYTPGSFTYSGSMSVTPEVLKSRRAELDGTEALSAGARDLLLVCCTRSLQCVRLHICTKVCNGNISESFLSQASSAALVALQELSVLSFACLHMSCGDVGLQVWSAHASTQDSRCACRPNTSSRQHPASSCSGAARVIDTREQSLSL